MQWVDQTVYCARFQDVYYTRAGGAAEKQHVFVEGTQLPLRFKTHPTTRILEMGFGSGLSFLVTASAYLQAVAAAGADKVTSEAVGLNFYSIEKYPLNRADLARIIAQWPDLAPLGRELLDQWPDLVPGFHRRYLAEGRIALTLIFGDVEHVLAPLTGPFDAFFLDGFNPSHNTAMWSDLVFQQMARLSAPGGRVATYSVCRQVVDGLRAAGFQVQKIPGFGAKKQMLVGAAGIAGHQNDSPPVDPRPRRSAPVVVIGAGVAGLTTARALARRGIAVQVWDAAAELGEGGSGNRAGIASPLISMDWNELSQLTGMGLGFLRADVARLRAEGHSLQADFCGVIQLGRDAKHSARQSLIAATCPFPPEFAQWLTAEQLTVLSGVPVAQAGWYFPGAGWLVPIDYLRAQADHPLIELVFGSAVHRLVSAGSTWVGMDAGGQPHFTSETVVLANADTLGTLLPELDTYITACRGQVSAAARQCSAASSPLGPPLSIPMMREGYGVDLPMGVRVFGASFKPEDRSLDFRAAERQENADRLAAISPLLCQSLEDSNQWVDRVSLRATTSDRLPLVGRFEPQSGLLGGEDSEMVACAPPGIGPSKEPTLYVNAGQGARGFTWCALLAEMLAADLMGELSPLPASLRQAIDPARFIRRAARRAAGRSGR